MKERRDALTALRGIALDDHMIADMICDLVEDDARFADHTEALLITLAGGETREMLEITAAAEAIDELDGSLAQLICELADLCPDHLCDPENCADQKH